MDNDYAAGDYVHDMEQETLYAQARARLAREGQTTEHIPSVTLRALAMRNLPSAYRKAIQRPLHSAFPE